MTDHGSWRSKPANTPSRRTILQATVGLGMGPLAVGPMSISACSTGTGTSRPSGSRADGSVVAALADTFTALDPLTDSSLTALTINDYIYQGLYRLAPYPPRIDLEPDLAVDIPRLVTPTTYRINLREDATFHDGSPVTASDVAFTLNLLMDPSTSPLYAGFFEIVNEVGAVGSHELEIVLKRPTSLLAERLGMLRVLSKAAVESSPEALRLSPVGSGPYRVVTATSNQIGLDLHQEYSGAREVTCGSIRLDIVTDENARISGLRTGGSDAIAGVPYSALEELDRTDRLEVAATPGAGPTSAVFNCGKAPFDQILMRQAVLYAIDRDAIADAAFFGHAEPAWESYFRPDTPDYITPQRVYRHDPGHARRLVSDAGYSGSSPDVEILVPNRHMFTAQSPIIEQNLRDIGLSPVMIVGDLLSHIERLSVGSYHIFLTSADATALGAADLEFQMRWQWYGFVPRELWHWTSPELETIETLLDGALSASEDDERRALLSEAQEIIQEQVPHAALHHRSGITAWSSDIRDFRPTPSVPGVLFDGVQGC